MSGLLYEELDMIEMIDEENVVVKTQNIAENSRVAKHALGKKVIGHGSLGSGSPNFQKMCGKDVD